MKKRKFKLQLFPVLFFIILTLYSITILIPMFWSLITSIRSRLEFIMEPFAWPSKIAFKNYREAFTQLYVTVDDKLGTRNVYLLELFKNTIIYALSCTVVSTMTRCISAYVVAKYNFRFKSLIYGTVIVVMVLPIVGNAPSMLSVMRSLGFYDNLAGIIVMSGGFTGMSFLIFYANFKSLSWDYAEAALIDGANHWTVLLKIMIPLSRITIFIMMLTTFITYWNEYTAPLLYMPNTPTVAYGLYKFQFNTSNSVSGVPHLMAACMLVFMPIFIIFLTFKNQLIGNLSMGGLKG